MRRKNSGMYAVALSAVLSLIVFVSYLIISPEITVVHAGGTNAVGANVFVANTCIPTLYNGNTVINFGSVAPGVSLPATNAETVNNFGNAPSNIYVDGGNWVFASNSFLVGNTIWAPTNGGTATQLTSTYPPIDTKIPVNLNNGVGNTIYFGVNVPATQAASAPSSYTQTINIMLSC
jgi:hypothetical protein